MKPITIPLLFFVITLIPLKGFSQLSPITYIVKDSVEIILDSVIRKSSSQNFYFAILIKDTSHFEIIPCTYNKEANSKSLGWILNTNRFLLIRNIRYPLLFDYDFKFGTLSENNIGEFGKRDGNIERRITMWHSDPIRFTQ